VVVTLPAFGEEGIAMLESRCGVHGLEPELVQHV